MTSKMEAGLRRVKMELEQPREEADLARAVGWKAGEQRMAQKSVAEVRCYLTQVEAAV